MDGLIERALSDYGVLVAALMVAIVWLALQLRQALGIIADQSAHIRKQSDTLLLLLAGGRSFSETQSPPPLKRHGE